jgi:hypothetical protein
MRCFYQPPVRSCTLVNALSTPIVASVHLVDVRGQPAPGIQSPTIKLRLRSLAIDICPPK